jgi:hypothetical protein
LGLSATKAGMTKDVIPFLQDFGKMVRTCSQQVRFANAANFRGEPYLPGTDLLTRYPGA